MVLVNNISARKFSRREVGGPAQRLQAGVRQLTGEHSTPTLDFFRAISAGECLVPGYFSRRVLSTRVVSTVTACGAKPNSSPHWTQRGRTAANIAASGPGPSDASRSWSPPPPCSKGPAPTTSTSTSSGGDRESRRAGPAGLSAKDGIACATAPQPPESCVWELGGSPPVPSALPQQEQEA
jgi:hypothetical protein